MKILRELLFPLAAVVAAFLVGAVLVAQPTRGVDIGGIEFIHRRLVELRDSGCAILLVSSELEEVTALADRLLVMRQGRIVAEVDPARTSTGEIGLLMTGGEIAA